MCLPQIPSTLMRYVLHFYQTVFGMINLLEVVKIHKQLVKLIQEQQPVVNHLHNLVKNVQKKLGSVSSQHHQHQHHHHPVLLMTEIKLPFRVEWLMMMWKIIIANNLKMIIGIIALFQQVKIHWTFSNHKNLLKWTAIVVN